jgi:hypothetical protein
MFSLTPYSSFQLPKALAGLSLLLSTLTDGLVKPYLKFNPAVVRTKTDIDFMNPLICGILPLI